jgi:hypothetical protein
MSDEEGSMFTNAGPESGNDPLLSQYPNNTNVAGQNPMQQGTATATATATATEPGTALFGADLNNVLGDDNTNIVAIAAEHNRLSSNSGLKKNLDTLLVKNYYAINMTGVTPEAITYLNSNNDSQQDEPANKPTVAVLNSKTGNIMDNQDFTQNAKILRVIRESIASIGETKTFKTSAGKNEHRVRVAGGDVGAATGKAVKSGASAVGKGASAVASGASTVASGVTNRLSGESTPTTQSGGEKFFQGQKLNLALYNALRGVGIKDRHQLKLAAVLEPCSQLIFGYTKDDSGKITKATGRFQAFGSGTYGAITGNFSMTLMSEGGKQKYTITLSSTEGQVVKSIISGLLKIPEGDMKVIIDTNEDSNPASSTTEGGKRKTKRRKSKSVRFKVNKHRKTAKKHRKSNKKYHKKK